MVSRYTSPDYAEYVLVFGTGVLFLPMLALPICSCMRLYLILFSKRWRSVSDWALTHVLGVTCLLAGCFIHSNYDVYLIMAGAIIVCVFPVTAFERLYGKILPQSS